MSRLVSRFVCSLCLPVVLVAGILGLPRAKAAEIKPFQVVSIASVDKIFADIDYITGVFEANELWQTGRKFIGPYFASIDRKRPAGFYFYYDEGELDAPVAIGFVPVHNLQIQLDILRGVFKEIEDAGEGVMKLSLDDGTVFYAKQKNKWAFLAMDARHLVDLPDDPSVFLGGLGDKYLLASRFLPQNMPEKFREEVIKGIRESAKEGFAADGLAPPGLEGEEPPAKKIDPELEKQMNEALETLLVRYFEGLDEWVTGINIDRERRSLHMDFSLVAAEGSELAKDFAAAKQAEAFLDLRRYDAAFIMHRVTRLPEAQQKFWDAVILNALAEFNAAEPPNENDRAAKEKAEKLLEKMWLATDADGLVEWGMSAVVLGEDATFVVGGMRLEKAQSYIDDVREITGMMAKDQEAYAKAIEWDFDKHGPYRIIKFNAEPMQKAFPQPKVEEEDEEPAPDKPQDGYIAVSDDFVLFATGKNSLPELKKLIDTSDKGVAGAGSPFLLSVSLSEALKEYFAQNPDDMFAAPIRAQLEKADGKDHVVVELEVVEDHTLRGRLEMEEGVLTTIGTLGRLGYEWYQREVLKGLEEFDPAPDADGGVF